ncbi:hypothetical protein [Priestia megaterium]|jgi:hypothetical protein|uniref:hypothetical protein n=1 Tax=Priestia megaterium TaxID=1404 RepID=UPI0004700499|nr:hypothetical protein [Priestia megaterium]PFB01869.1 hypothetical protein CN383_11225 [Priestia megaterium]
MKLKIVSSLIVLSFIVTLFSVQGNAFAAMLDSKVVYLGKSVKTASTKRINVYPGQNIQINVEPSKYGSQGKVSWAIFRDGKKYQSGVTTKANAPYVEPYFATSGQYSLRLYCGARTKTQTGCYADGSIFAIRRK